MGYGYGKTTSHSQTTATRYADSARVKCTFDNRMLAHVWAQRTQTFGKSNNGNFYFEDSCLYSYGTHYLVGFIAKSGVVFLNSDKNSVTTSGHKSDAWQAVRHLESHAVPDLTALKHELPSELDRRARCLVDHVAKHVCAMSPEASAALLIEAGHKAGPKTFALVEKMRRAAVAKAEKEKAADKAAEFQRNLNYAKRFAGMTDSDFGRVLSDALKRVYLPRHSEPKAPGFYVDLFHYQKAAKAKSWTRIAARLGEFRKQIKAGFDLKIRKLRAADVNRYTKSQIREIRHALAILATGAPLPVAWDYSKLASACTFVRMTFAEKPLRCVPELTVEKLSVLGAWAQHEYPIRTAIENEEYRAKRARELAALHATQAEKRELWLAGENVPGFRGTDENGGALIRAKGVELDSAGNITGGTLETSQGAQVPLPHAVRAFRFVKLCRESGRTWQANGRTIRVGHFEIDSVNPDGFKAGCHVIGWQECERLARLLGVFDLAPDDSALVPSNALEHA